MSTFPLPEKVIYAQFVVGAPGAGKTSYCNAMSTFLSQLGRETILVDFDPAHTINVSPHTDLSLAEFITVDQIMEQFSLGPNGALIYAMEWLEDHLTPLISTKLLEVLASKPDCRYILFDLPGQIELYTNSGAIQRVLQKISQEWGFRSVVVHLTDSVLCLEPSHYISSVLVSLSVMLNLQLPHVNVLSKVDLFPSSSTTRSSGGFFNQNEHFLMNGGDNDDHDDDLGMNFDDFGKPGRNGRGLNLDFFDGNYLEGVACQIDEEFRYGADSDDDDDDDFYGFYDDDDEEEEEKDQPNDSKCSNHEENEEKNHKNVENSEKKVLKQPTSRVKKYLKSFREINHGIVELIEDFSLVQLTHLSINDKYSMVSVLKSIDKANGYAFQDMDLQSMQVKEFHDSMRKNQQQIEQIVKKDRGDGKK